MCVCVCVCVCACWHLRVHQDCPRRYTSTARARMGRAYSKEEALASVGIPMLVFRTSQQPHPSTYVTTHPTGTKYGLERTRVLHWPVECKGTKVQ